jgi:hypothetical protein
MARFSNFVFYADDPNSLATFWAAVLGYPPPDPEGFAAFVADHGVTPEMVAASPRIPPASAPGCSSITRAERSRGATGSIGT